MKCHEKRNTEVNRYTIPYQFTSKKCPNKNWLTFKIKITRNLSIFGIQKNKKASEAARWFYHSFVYFKNVNTSDDCIIDWILYLRCLYTLFHKTFATRRSVHETLFRWTNEKKKTIRKNQWQIFLKNSRQQLDENPCLLMNKLLT